MRFSVPQNRNGTSISMFFPRKCASEVASATKPYYHTDIRYITDGVSKLLLYNLRRGLMQSHELRPHPGARSWLDAQNISRYDNGNWGIITKSQVWLNNFRKIIIQLWQNRQTIWKTLCNPLASQNTQVHSNLPMHS